MLVLGAHMPSPVPSFVQAGFHLNTKLAAPLDITDHDIEIGGPLRRQSGDKTAAEKLGDDVMFASSPEQCGL